MYYRRLAFLAALCVALSLLSGCFVPELPWANSATSETSTVGQALSATSESSDISSSTANHTDTSLARETVSTSIRPATITKKAPTITRRRTVPAATTTTVIKEQEVTKPVTPPTTPATTAAPVKEEALSTALTPLSPSQYYGRQQLQTAGETTVLAAYERIAAAVEKFEQNWVETDSDSMDWDARVSIADLNITRNQLQRAYQYYVDDYPQHFWRGNYGYSFYYDKQNRPIIVDLLLQYSWKSKAAMQTARTAMHTAVAEMLKGLSASQPDYERAEILHDRLVEHVSYLESDNAHDMYGALVKQEAVCEGYARAYQYLLYQAGIPALIALGSAYSDDTLIGHAWNVVKLGGDYYHTDVTWDDPSPNAPLSAGKVFRAYLQTTTAEMERDHILARATAQDDSSYFTSYALPVCTATRYNYYVRNGLVLNALSISDVAEVLAAGANTGTRFIQFRVPGTAEEAAKFIVDNANWRAIIAAANAKITNVKNRIFGYPHCHMLNVAVAVEVS